MRLLNLQPQKLREKIYPLQWVTMKNSHLRKRKLVRTIQFKKVLRPKLKRARRVKELTLTMLQSQPMLWMLLPLVQIEELVSQLYLKLERSDHRKVMLKNCVAQLSVSWVMQIQERLLFLINLEKQMSRQAKPVVSLSRSVLHTSHPRICKTTLILWPLEKNWNSNFLDSSSLIHQVTNLSPIFVPVVPHFVILLCSLSILCMVQSNRLSSLFNYLSKRIRLSALP